MAVQWFRLCASNVGLIPGQGSKIPQDEQCGKKKKKECTTEYAIEKSRILNTTPRFFFSGTLTWSNGIQCSKVIDRIRVVQIFY